MPFNPGSAYIRRRMFEIPFLKPFRSVYVFSLISRPGQTGRSKEKRKKHLVVETGHQVLATTRCKGPAIAMRIGACAGSRPVLHECCSKAAPTRVATGRESSGGTQVVSALLDYAPNDARLTITSNAGRSRWLAARQRNSARADELHRTCSPLVLMSLAWYRRANRGLR